MIDAPVNKYARIFLLLVSPLVCAPTLTLLAQQPKPPSADDLLQRYPESMKLYHDKRYAEAAALLEPFYSAGPATMGWYWSSAMYDLACEEALAGRKQKALEILAAWQAAGISVSAQQLATDTDLASLHDDPQFTRLVQIARSADFLWAREPGQSLPLTPNLSDDAKIAGLSTLWSEARFNFAFFDRQPNLDWNQAYLDFLPRIRATQSTEAYYRVLMQFAALLKDGHTDVYPPEALQNDIYARPGLHTQLIENTVLVTAIDDPALLTQGWHIGDQLLKIDDEDIQHYAAREIAPYQSSSTPQDLQVRTFDYALLTGRAGTNIHVTVRDAAGIEHDRTLTRLTLADEAKIRKSPKASFLMRPDGIAVLTINEFEDTEGTQVLLANRSLIASSQGLIIDVRANGGGSTPVDLLQALSRQPIRGALVRTRSYLAAYRAKGVLPGWADLPPFEVPPDTDHPIDVPVAVLTSGRTFSAAEDFVAAFDAMHRGITVGEPTAGSTGQPFFFQLPGGGSARVCTRNDRAPDGTAFEAIGLQPTFLIAPTIASIRQGKDITLDRAAQALLAKAK